MKTLDIYIGKTIFAATMLCLITLTGLSALIKFVEQMGKVGRGDYQIMDAAFYVVLNIPVELELFFPMAALLGALIGLGSMASSSELVVMQAAGISRFQIVISVIKTAVPMMLVVMLLGEFGAPEALRKAKEMRTMKLSGGSMLALQRGVWAKDGRRFVNIGAVTNQDELTKLKVYQFNSSLNLEQIMTAERANFMGEHWRLHQAKVTHFKKDEITIEEFDHLNWQSSLTPEKLGVVKIKPDALSLSGLSSYLDYLRSNQQDTSRYELAFWRKLLLPTTVVVMMLLALSFVFGPLRSVTMGARLVMGIVAGFTFYISNEMFGPLSLVFKLPAIWGAISPSLLFLAVTLYLLRRA